MNPKKPTEEDATPKRPRRIVRELPDPIHVKARERCLKMLEAKRLLSEAWHETHEDQEYEKRLIENALACVRTALRELCKAHKLPFE
jgi:hypothetical protein